jgi:hypothetical protein
MSFSYSGSVATRRRDRERESTAAAWTSAQGTSGRVRGAWLRRAVLMLVVFAALSIAPAARATAPLVIPPIGKTYNYLAVAWWQYALGQPTATNPLLDRTGASCTIGQSGPVFFLTGTSGTGTAVRDACIVSGPRALFFPLVNAFDVHTPGDGLDTPALVYKDFQSFGFRADSLSASVDGVPIRNLDPTTTPYHACAAPVQGCAPSSFSLMFPDDNLFGLPAGKYAPAVQDGYYLLIAPLRPGRHTVTFGGTGNFNGPFTQDITYHLVVTRPS